MKNNKLSLHGLFANNKFVFVFSLALAFITWIAVAMVASPETTRVIKNVPIKINLENSVPEKFNLQIFGEKEFFVDIVIKGKRYVVNSKNVNAQSFDVIAQTDYVDSPGKQQLNVKATIIDSSADYVIDDISDNFIEVYFDQYKETKLPVEAKIEFNGSAYIPEGYISGEPFVSVNSETASEVTVSGPATQVNTLKNVYAYVLLDKVLTETTALNADIRPVDEFGMEAKYIKINNEDNPKVTVTVPVLKTGMVDTTVNLTGIPDFYKNKPLSFTCSPAQEMFAMPEVDFENNEKFVLGEIDYSEIGAKVNEFTFTKADIENSGLKVLGDTEEFVVRIDASGLSEKTVTLNIEDIKITNNKPGQDVFYSVSNIDITVVGPESSLEKINEDSIAAELSLKNSELSADYTPFDIKVSLNNAPDCWIYGSYSVSVSN